MNRKLKIYKKILEIEVERQKVGIQKEINNHIEGFNAIMLEPFSCDEPYTGLLVNRIFFTYSDCYRANNPLSMLVEHLHHPYRLSNDRGYIKGVVTDLNGYMKLRSASLLYSNIDIVQNIYRPRFPKSKYRTKYIVECRQIDNEVSLTMSIFIQQKKEELNAVLKEKTGCSLLHYIRTI